MCSSDLGQPGALRLGRPLGRSVRFAAASWEPWTLRAVVTGTSAALGARATRRASVGGTAGGCFGGARDGHTDGRSRARRRAGASGLKFEKRWRGAGGKAAAPSCAGQSCAPPGGGERRAGWRSTRRGPRDPSQGAAGGAWPPPGPGSTRSGQLAPQSPEPSRQPRALTFQLRRRPSSLQGPGTSTPKGRRCGTGANWPKCGSLAAALPSLPSRPLPRRGSPTTPVAAAARLYPVPIVPPPRPASTRTQPRSPLDCSEAAAPPPARPPARPVPAPGNVSTLPSPDRLRARPIGRKERAGPPHWPGPHIERANGSCGFRSPWRPMLLRARGPGEGGE